MEQQSAHDEPLSGLTILVVEPAKQMRDLLQGLLADLGAEHVVTLAKPQETLDALLRDYPDMVLLNADMDADKAFALVESIRQHQTLADPDLPLLMLTGTDTPTFRAKASSCGADAFIEQPITPQKLYEALVFAFLYAAPIPQQEAEEAMEFVSDAARITVPTLH